jgi:hypothetical protein
MSMGPAVTSASTKHSQGSAGPDRAGVALSDPARRQYRRLQRPDARIALGKRGGDRGRCVGGLIIDHNNAQSRTGLGAKRREAARDVGGFIAPRNDDGEARRLPGKARGTQRAQCTTLARGAQQEPDDGNQP